MKRVHVFYSGCVQGVGFRYTVRDIAAGLNSTGADPAARLVGRVRNLRDGRVELAAESEEAALRGFLDRVDDAFGANIEGAEVQWGEGAGEFVDFTIGQTV